MYADDTSLLVTGNDLHSRIASLNNALQDLCSWFISNPIYFPIYSNKTFYMIFHRSRIKWDTDNTSDSTLEIIMDNSILTKTACLKYLGVIVD